MLAGFSKRASLSVPCTSWQLEHFTPRVYLRLNGIEPGGIHDCSAGRVGNVIATRSVAALAPNVPLRHSFRLGVVIDGMAAVAEWASGPLHVVWRIERRPPVGSIPHEVGAPHLMGNVPLRRQHEIVIAYPLEVALLPLASVNERNIVFCKFHERIWTR